MKSRGWLPAAATALAAALLAAGPATTAAANPATAARYAGGASATIYSGRAFDTCTAPPASTIGAWQASPYRALGIYIGGVDRHCPQPALTGPWVATVSVMGWRLIPVYKGLQAPCGTSAHKISPAAAAAQGSAAAADADASARVLGLLSGSAIYNDMEAYPAGNASCRAAVLAFLSGWTSEIHRRGYVAGVYAQLYSGADDLAKVYASAAYARPDALWIARYDLNPSLAGWAGIPATAWTAYQRAKQYRGGHDETFGGVTLNIDNDQFNAPVATVGYGYQVAGTGPLTARTGPAASYPVAGTFAAGAALTVSCQAPGTKVGTSALWDKLANGWYVSDYFVSTPSETGYSAPLPRCAYPFQVTAPGGLSERTGPGSSHPVRGRLAAGALARVSCQRSGTRTGTTPVWDKLTNGRWVSDYYLSSLNKKTFSRPVPRC
jgi:Domain of unknown function (DUF1906)